MEFQKSFDRLLPVSFASPCNDEHLLEALELLERSGGPHNPVHWSRHAVVGGQQHLRFTPPPLTSADSPGASKSLTPSCAWPCAHQAPPRGNAPELTPVQLADISLSTFCQSYSGDDRVIEAADWALMKVGYPASTSPCALCTAPFLPLLHLWRCPLSTSRASFLQRPLCYDPL